MGTTCALNAIRDGLVHLVVALDHPEVLVRLVALVEELLRRQPEERPRADAADGEGVDEALRHLLHKLLARQAEDPHAVELLHEADEVGKVKGLGVAVHRHDGHGGRVAGEDDHGLFGAPCDFLDLLVSVHRERHRAVPLIHAAEPQRAAVVANANVLAVPRH